MLKKANDMDLKIVNKIKCLAIDMIESAQSGHPGIVLGGAPIIYALYKDHLNFDSKDPSWINRDRFVMSSGHGSALLYSNLYMFGYDYSIDDLKDFRKLNSKTSGHPEYNLEYGIEMTTGPLGQGLASAVGMAIAEKYLNSINSNYDYNVYTYCSDGDLMEGISYESASLAGTLELNNLIVLYDSNNICLDGKTKKSFDEKVLKRFEALNWNTLKVKDGNSVNEISKAIEKAKKETKKPTIIEIKTVIGKDSVKEGTNTVHGSPLKKNDIYQLKEKLNENDFYFSPCKEEKEYLENIVKKRIVKRNEILNEKININFGNFKNEDYSNVQLRKINGMILNYIANQDEKILSGSADLFSSTKTYLEDKGDFSKVDRTGRNLFFGIREHAMGAIANGIALSGLKPFISTFLVFSDYLKPSIRLAAMMNLNVTYIFTHDAIDLGKDGPTHQPIEQLSGLRSIPNLTVYRPNDYKELLGTYEDISNRKGPSVIIISRDSKSDIKETKKEEVKNGAYIIKKESKKIDGIILASGSDLSLGIEVYNDLKEYDLRVVSVPSIENFKKQSKKYQEQILPKDRKCFVIEKSSGYSYNFLDCYKFTINQFGKSGSKNEVLEDFGFTKELISAKIKKELK